jgi:hypothetical protein
MKKNQNMPVSAQQNGFGPEFLIAYTVSAQQNGFGPEFLIAYTVLELRLVS